MKNNTSHHLYFLILSFCVAILLANWFDARLIIIFGLHTDAGTLIFPLTFMLANIITEVYGYEQTRRAIWYGFVFNAVFIAYSQLITLLPSPDYAIYNQAFDALIAASVRIIIASTISYFCAEFLNAYVLAKLKIKLQGRYMALRFLGSTLVAAGFDSVIFCLLAFYGTIPNPALFNFIITMWFIKVFIELILLPFSTHLAQSLKSIEQLDTYDISTNFSLFKLKD